MDKITKRMIRSLIARLEHISNPQPIRKNEPTPHAESESDIEAGHTYEDVPIAGTITQPQPSETHYQVTCKTENDWWNKFKPFVEIGGVVLLFVYTLYTIKMYRANKEAADAATLAANTAAAALHLDQRAWVTAQRGDFKWQIRENMIFPGRSVNSGKTPAKHVEFVATATLMQSDQSPEFNYQPNSGHPAIHSRVDLLYGSGADPIIFKLPVYKRGTHSGEILKLTKEILRDMDAAKLYVVMHGRITYQDVFGIEHWTTFCDIFPTEGRTLPKLSQPELECIAYNDIDKNR